MKDFAKKIYLLIKPFIKWQIIGLILTILGSVALFAAPLVSRHLIDEVIPAGSLHNLTWGLVFFFIVCVSQPFIEYFKNLVFINITERITLSIREKLFEKIIHAPLKFFDSVKKGEIISRVLNDGGALSSFLSNVFITFIKDVSFCIITLIGMIYVSYKITLVILLVFSLYIPFNILLSKKLGILSLEVQTSLDNLCTVINQSCDKILPIKALSLEELTVKEFKSASHNLHTSGLKISKYSITLGTFLSVMVVSSLSVIYGYGAYLVMEGSLSIGQVVAMGMYFQFLIQAVSGILGNNISIQKFRPIIERIYEYLHMDAENYKNEEQTVLDGDIFIQNLCFSYEPDTPVLKNINMNIRDKEFAAIVGKSGSGKSTLINILMGFYNIPEGRVYIGGKDISKMGVEALRKNIGFVPQRIELFNKSIMDNIRRGRLDAKDEEVIEACRKVGLHEKIMGLPHGYETVITENLNFSGGESQKLGIARALLRKPSLIILDEPTSSLDPESERIIKNIISKIKNHCTVLVIAHRLTTILNADKIFIIEDGKIADEGSHESLIQRNNLYFNFVSGSLIKQSL